MKTLCNVNQNAYSLTCREHGKDKSQSLREKLLRRIETRNGNVAEICVKIELRDEAKLQLRKYFKLSVSPFCPLSVL